MPKQRQLATRVPAQPVQATQTLVDAATGQGVAEPWRVELASGQDRVVQPRIGLCFDADGIARLIAPGDTPSAVAPPRSPDILEALTAPLVAATAVPLAAYPLAATSSGSGRPASASPHAANASARPSHRAARGASLRRIVSPSPIVQDTVDASSAGATSSTAIVHTGKDGVTLAARIRAALADAKSGGKGHAATTVLIDLTGPCTEAEMLEITHGEVVLRGRTPDADGGVVTTGDKVRLALLGVRIKGGSLCLEKIELCASEENTVQAGSLRCTDCLITSRNGCGVLCLQKAKVFLKNCEVSHCMRSGVGVNGKNSEIDLHECAIVQNNFSGIGVNHQARSITLRGNRITGNGYHGIWLNAGVTAQWIGGQLSGNKLSDKDGPGVLHDYKDSQ